MTGDRVLQETAVALKSSLRPGDLVARIGGDEFAAIASGLTLRQAESRMQAVLTAVTRQLDESKGLPAFSLSCGVAECSAGDTAQSLVGRADQALYDAKRRGKNRVSVRAVPFIRELLPVRPWSLVPGPWSRTIDSLTPEGAKLASTGA